MGGNSTRLLPPLLLLALQPDGKCGPAECSVLVRLQVAANGLRAGRCDKYHQPSCKHSWWGELSILAPWSRAGGQPVVHRPERVLLRWPGLPARAPYCQLLGLEPCPPRLMSRQFLCDCTDLVSPRFHGSTAIHRQDGASGRLDKETNHPESDGLFAERLRGLRCLLHHIGDVFQPGNYAAGPSVSVARRRADAQQPYSCPVCLS
mmetsp:Transcript_5106/g.12072  ORF Transcript_5106/g.12072 Transcript_5106/m.12072 type:complete len:205 (+) Transcript_5106:744-1358(+)